LKSRNGREALEKIENRAAINANRCAAIPVILSYSQPLFLQMSSSHVSILHTPVPAEAEHVWTPAKQANGSWCRDPVELSDALCDFFGLPHETTLPRPEVTKGIFKYARSHSLMSGQYIAQDDALRVLFGTVPDLRVLNLQEHLRPHLKYESVKDLEAWWTARGSPPTVAVNAEGTTAWDFFKLHDTLSRFPAVNFVVYTNRTVTRTVDPCGCYAPNETHDGICNYHREEEPDTAICGCSVTFKIKCSFHA
jgi:hypothetical protein